MQLKNEIDEIRMGSRLFMTIFTLTVRSCSKNRILWTTCGLEATALDWCSLKM